MIKHLFIHFNRSILVVAAECKSMAHFLPNGRNSFLFGPFYLPPGHSCVACSFVLPGTRSRKEI